MKCPLAFVRIVTPIRSIHCSHLQCFDANTFLVMNEQTPTWSCPVCYKKIDSCDDLVLDGYFLEILNDTPSHIDSVKVETDGQITLINESSSPGDESDVEEEVPKNKEETVVELLDDDDNNNSIPNNKILLKRSREDDNSILTNDDIQPQQNYVKKQRQDVIDLTLSSDDEDESESPPLLNQPVITHQPFSSGENQSILSPTNSPLYTNLSSLSNIHAFSSQS